MTRENKLALVVGFALVLFVGILVSDHYSSVQNTRGADLHDAGALAQKPASRLIDLRGPQPAGNSGATLARSAGTGETGPVQIPQARDPRGGTGDIQLGPNVNLPREQPQQTPEQIAGRIEPPAPGGTLGVPAETTYVVKRGDTLYSISEATYGDARMWKRVQEYNGLQNPKDIAPGLKLRMPQGATPDRTIVDGRTGASELTQPVKFEEYTVREGDTLSEIARRRLGTRTRWQELFELNRDRMRNPDDVTPGTILKLPAGGASKSARVNAARTA